MWPKNKVLGPNFLQEMELSKQEMELFFPHPGLESKNCQKMVSLSVQCVPPLCVCVSQMFVSLSIQCVHPCVIINELLNSVIITDMCLYFLPCFSSDHWPFYFTSFIATLGLHLGFSASLRIWQVSACKMEPRSGTIITGPLLNSNLTLNITRKYFTMIDW